MLISEVFTYPTVREVIFQIRFPELFYITEKVGEFQLKILEKFPKSTLLTRKQLIVFEGSDQQQEELLKGQDTAAKSIWQFTSTTGCILNLMRDSLSLVSKEHKTFDNPEGAYKFKDEIDFAIKTFFEIIKVPIINRIGLRYVDYCPLKERTNEFLTTWYNTVFPTARFNFNVTDAYQVKITSKKDDLFLNYSESLVEEEGKHFLQLDFDGVAINIEPSAVMDTTTRLHAMISEEFSNSIKQPLTNYMRTGVFE